MVGAEVERLGLIIIIITVLFHTVMRNSIRITIQHSDEETGPAIPICFYDSLLTTKNKLVD